jgi:negative regulator of sigma E activity
MTITHMNDPVCEQLSAWMDGELSPEETKFLERRLQHDEQLQAMFSRMQLMSACMKRQQIMPMDLKLCAKIKTAIESETLLPATLVVAKKRNPIFAWAAAASVAAMAVVFAPRLWQDNTQQQVPVMVSAQTPETNIVPSFASADMVASFPQEISTEKKSPVAASTISPDEVLQDQATLRGEQSPMPLADVESPENFPLNVSAQKKTWPRSSLATGSDPVMEAYLVRHNQMMNDGGGLSGFVPYVDVMAEDQPSANQQIPSNRDAEVNHQ